jgi:hypothetical protein
METYEVGGFLPRFQPLGIVSLALSRFVAVPLFIQIEEAA